MSSKKITTFGPFTIHFGQQNESNRITLSIRELEASQFFTKPQSREYSKYSGCMIWDASVVLGRFIYHHHELFKGKTVLELGSGCGASGLLVSHFCQRVILTDYIEQVSDIIVLNIS